MKRNLLKEFQLGSSSPKFKSQNTNQPAKHRPEDFTLGAIRALRQACFEYLESLDPDTLEEILNRS